MKFGFDFLTQRLKQLLAKAPERSQSPQKGAACADEKSAAPAEQEDEHQACCAGKVHIFYRGVSDDHLYVARQRHWNEVKFFRPRGLKVFCQDCRRRLY